MPNPLRHGISFCDASLHTNALLPSLYLYLSSVKTLPSSDDAAAGAEGQADGGTRLLSCVTAEAGVPTPMSPARRRMQEQEEAEAKEQKARELMGVRKYMYDVVQSDQFTNSVTACILFNTIVLAINYYGASSTYVSVLEAMNTVCTFVFLVRPTHRLHRAN